MAMEAPDQASEEELLHLADLDVLSNPGASSTVDREVTRPLR